MAVEINNETQYNLYNDKKINLIHSIVKNASYLGVLLLVIANYYQWPFSVALIGLATFLIASIAVQFLGRENLVNTIVRVYSDKFNTVEINEAVDKPSEYIMSLLGPNNWEMRFLLPSKRHAELYKKLIINKVEAKKLFPV